MSLLTIRNLDEGVKQRLRERAARNKRSMEAEARAILEAAVAKGPPLTGAEFVKRVRRRFKGLYTDLPIPPRTGGRPPPDFR
jgi:hypothetical protein